jgi:hypothetical protein
VDREREREILPVYSNKEIKKGPRFGKGVVVEGLWYI